MRLFIGVELGDAVMSRVREELGRLRPKSPDSKWVPAENAHLTLAFLGWVDPEQLPGIAEAMRQVAARHRPVTLHVHGGGGFGSLKRPRVLWVGIGGEVEPLGRVQADLAEALKPLGFEPELREFKPHLTIARSRGERGDDGLAKCAELLAETELGQANVRELVLFESKLSPKGAVYSAVERAPLSA